jgi:dipeptidyl aminopeptidase/acylaminoacyl peptidase
MSERQQSTPRTIVSTDLYNLSMASDAQISPDGSRVVFVKTWLDKGKNDYRSSLYSVASDGGDVHRLTAADAKDGSPRWSPDGTYIAFLSNRAEKNQIYVLPVAGGEAWKLTDFTEGVSFFAWSPDGSTIAAVSKGEPGADSEKKDDADNEGEESDVIHITSIRYKADGTKEFLDGKRQHIWCVSFPTGDTWQVTSGDFDDTNPSWTPGGNEIVFVSDRTEDRDYNRVRQIWSVSARGGEPRLVIGEDNDMFGLPAVSPDGATVAIRGHRNAIAGSSPNQRIWTVPLAGGDPLCLTENLDRSTADTITADFSASSSPGLTWSADGLTVYFQVSDQGSVHLYGAGKESDPAPVITGDRRILDYSVSPDGGKIAFTASDQISPPDVFVCDIAGGNERRLTCINADFLDGVTLAEPEEFWVKSYNDDGWLVHGWIMKPPNMEAGGKYPMILAIHGGPHGTYGNSFFHEFQTMAAKGYVVVYTNPRGSQGYGEEFCSCTRMNWGVADMPDLMAAVDYAIEQGYVDENRLGVTGGSYGGFMTNWVIGHTDRFKAAITDRCVSNFYSMYGTSDIGFTFGDYEWGGRPWENREQYVEYSPITYVENMKTPLLIVHSEKDYRCPIEQSEQLFVFLKMLGRTTEFVRFPDESHGLSRSGQPKHRVQRLNFYADWWERYL